LKIDKNKEWKRDIEMEIMIIMIVKDNKIK